MGHLLALMGSGETTPTMVTVHQRLAARAGDAPRAVLLDTPYGFQENADDITAKALEYFDRRVGLRVEHVEFRRDAAVTGLAREQAFAAVRDADWVFCGPGSPTYLLRQWAGTELPGLVRGRLAGDGVTVFASAAAVTVGTRAVPVYEVYKVGADPRWADGLDLVGVVGLPVVVIPHFDNNEGGGHDTRFCYLGETRLAQLEDELDDDEWVLGIDEHTALLLDLGTATFTVAGRGGVTVRVRGSSRRFTAGPDERGIDELRAAAAALRGAGPSGDGRAVGDTPSVPADPPGRRGSADEAPGAHGRSDPFEDLLLDTTRAFDAAREADDWPAATEAALALEEGIRAWAADTLTGDAMDRAVAALRRMLTALGAAAAAGSHDHAELVRPLVEVLLELRATAREDRDFATADRIRDALVAADVEVRDAPDGTDWEYLP